MIKYGVQPGSPKRLMMLWVGRDVCHKKNEIWILICNFIAKLGTPPASFLDLGPAKHRSQIIQMSKIHILFQLLNRTMVQCQYKPSIPNVVYIDPQGSSTTYKGSISKHVRYEISRRSTQNQKTWQVIHETKKFLG